MAASLQMIAGVRSHDVIYLYLPLYHTAGFLMGLCGAIERGDFSLRNTSLVQRHRKGFQWEIMLKSLPPLFQASQSLYVVNSQRPSSGTTAGSTM